MADKKKMCFIACINNEEWRSKIDECLNNLIIPEDMQIEKIYIESNINVAKAYNSAMIQSDAKYKVYLREKVLINNKNFIMDFMKIFSENNEIGIIGVAGAKVIPTSGIWWESWLSYGKVYDSHTGIMELLSFNEIDGEYEKVRVIDGLIMITQYDLPWKEDKFNGSYFYESSQCMEFKRKRYEIAVARQEEAWCSNDCGTFNSYEEFFYYRDIFLNEYSSDLYPLVSILIPAYNRVNYLELALKSAISQTYKNTEIIIGDDSTNADVKEMIKPYTEKYKNIIYIDNGGPLGEAGIKNVMNLMTKSKGEYINFLYDDDLFHPDKIAKMMDCILKYDNVSMVTSYRQLIDQDGKELPYTFYTQRLYINTDVINTKVLGNWMIKNMVNVIGEPTTVLVKKGCLDNKWGFFNGRQFKYLVDLAQWLDLFKKGTVVYIPDALSYFRQHEGQNSGRADIGFLGIVDRFHLIWQGYKEGTFLWNKNEFEELLKKWMTSSIGSLPYLKILIERNEPYFIDLKKVSEEIYECYNNAIKYFLKIE